MGRLIVSESGDYLERNGKPFFLLSDTDWMAFQKLSVDEWRELVVRRKEQGFNSLQISVMPIAHDNSASENEIHPFAVVDGKYDFEKIDHAYFEKAQKMLDIMREYDMIPFLHLFWVNYIPDTWAAERSPDTVIPFERIRPLAAYFIECFREFDPIYSVSGDTKFETEQVTKYYLEILNVLHEKDPEGLTTLHLSPTADPPEVLCEHPQYHFYSYQSGHSVGANENDCTQTAMLDFSKQFLGKVHKKPIINTEPCYEGHGYGCTYGRFNAYDVRRAIWLSLLSGSKAGVTYGAHGVWQMYHAGEEFNGIAFSSLPYDWHDAIRFPGAWDAGFSKWVFEHYDMFGIKPSKAMAARSELIQMAEDENMVVIYMPYHDELTVLRDLTGYKIEMIAMDTKKMITPLYTVANGETIFHLSSCNEDMLIIAKKQ